MTVAACLATRQLLTLAASAGRIGASATTRSTIFQSRPLVATKTYFNRDSIRTFVSASQPAFAATAADIAKGIETVTDLFTVARDELEYAEEAKGSVYYNDDKAAAVEAIEACLAEYQKLLSTCDTEQKNDIQRRVGLRVLELDAQLQALNAEELE